MKIGDRVHVTAPGTFDGRTGVIKGTLPPDYEWSVLLDGTTDPEDQYGFATTELTVIS